MTARSTALALVVALASAISGCVRLSYSVHNVQEPITDEQLDVLQPGTSDLGQCLQHLGGPQFVWEYDGSGAALGWVFEDSSGWGLSVSYSLAELASASFSYDSTATDLPGVVLWFDRDLHLLQWRRGNMRQLIRGMRPRPAPTEQVFDDGP